MKFVLPLIFAFVSIFAVQSHGYSGAGGQEFVQEYVYDFAVKGGAIGPIDLTVPSNVLPAGAVVLSAHYQVLTAMTSGGSATVAIGDAGTAAKYLAATAYNDAAYAANVPKVIAIGVPGLVDSTNAGKVRITIATAALTAGKIRFVFRGYVPKG